MTVVPINDPLEIRASLLHGRGVFARQSIAAGTRLLEYSGERITKEESLRRCEAGNVFIIGLDDAWDIDGAVGENPARYVNHSCAPNCEAVIEEEVTLELASEPPVTPDDLRCEGMNSESRIYIDAVRDIAAGEELTFNYGYDLDNYDEHPCRCGAPTCVGFIVAEEFFPELHRRRQARPDAAPAPTGQDRDRTSTR